MSGFTTEALFSYLQTEYGKYYVKAEGDAPSALTYKLCEFITIF